MDRAAASRAAALVVPAAWLLCALPVVLAWLASALIDRPALALAAAAAGAVAMGAALAARRVGVGGVWLGAVGLSVLAGELSAVGFGGQQGRILWVDGVVVAGVLVALASREVSVPRAPFLLLLVPLLAWSALGLLAAPDPLTGLAEVKEWVVAGLAGAAALAWARDARRARVVLATVTCTGVAIAAAMSWAALRHPAGAVLAVMMKLVDLPWGRSNYLAGILILAFPVTLGLLGGSGRGLARVAFALALLALGAGLVVSASKGAILALVLAMAVACATGGRAARKPALVLLAVLAAGAAAYLASPLRDVLDYRLQASALDYSAGERLSLYAVAWDLFLRHPIVGVGLNNFSVLSNALHGIDIVPHNLELGWLAELGVVGALVGLTWVAALGWTAWRARACARAPRDQALALGLWGAWLAFLLHNQIESTLYGEQFKLLLFMVAAGTWRLAHETEGHAWIDPAAREEAAGRTARQEP